jgi:alkylhydroperoxidase family enzyme
MGLLVKITPLPLKIAANVLLQCIKVKAVGMRVCECCVAFHTGRKGRLRREILTSDIASSSGGE